MGLLPSTIFFQNRMGVHILNGLIYNICEVYIDDMLVFGETDDAFIRNVTTVFHRCREKNVTLNAKKIVIGLYTVPFVGHEIRATGIKMSKKRTESAISIGKPNSLKELQSFLGLLVSRVRVRVTGPSLKDHLRDHFAIAKPLYDMVTVTTRNKIKQLTWTNEEHLAFE
jgi:hypothetical protein